MLKSLRGLEMCLRDGDNTEKQALEDRVSDAATAVLSPASGGCRPFGPAEACTALEDPRVSAPTDAGVKTEVATSETRVQTARSAVLKL